MIKSQRAVVRIDTPAKPKFKSELMVFKKIWKSKSDRTHLRFKGGVSDAIRFEHKNALLPRQFEILNVSLGGIALCLAENVKCKRGEILAGVLSFGSSKFDAELEVRHVTKHVVGCRFTRISREALGELEEYLESALVGAGLHLIRRDILKHDGPGEPTWYADANKNEIYYVFDSSKLIRFHLTFMGHHIQWQVGKPVRLGIVKKETNTNPQMYKPSDIILAKEHLSSHLIDLAVCFMGAVPNLDNSIVQEMKLILNAETGAK